MKAKVAAVVSAYFCELFLEDRIDNLLSQTPQPQVIVVAMEGSPEQKIALECQKKAGCESITIVQTPNVPTVYAAWNMGIKCSESDYICNANSDDRLYPEAFRIMVKMLDRSPEHAVVYSDVDRVNSIGGKPIGRYQWLEGGLPELLSGCFLGPMPMWRRSLHEKYGYFDEDYTSAGDYEFWLRLAAGGEKFKHVHAALGAYLERKSSLEHRSPVRSTWETARARSLYRKDGKNGNH